ncbi:MAG TPA: hypothetical protein VE010_03430, partial [Thermoanaerobaculia bacterium]|nr:hypothetical protein [Thermoanaerobaculia bacterium]
PIVTIAPGEIKIEFARGEGDLTATQKFGERIHINGLPAGTYTVTVKSPDVEYVKNTLEVLPAPFKVSPTALGYAPAEILIEGLPVVDCGRFCLPLEVRVRNSGATQLATDVRYTAEGAIIARVPQGYGLSDVIVRTPDGVAHTLLQAYTQVSDPTYEGEDAEWVMFPLNFRGRGAHGSDWRTEIVVRNEGPVTMPAAPLTPGPTPVTALPPGGEVLCPEELDEGGAYLFMPLGAAKWLTFSSHIADRSRSATDRGTEIPVVRREDTASQIRLLNIPIDSAFRARLRVYDYDLPDRQRKLTLLVARADGTTTRIPLQFPSRLCGVEGCDPGPSLVAFDLSSDPRIAGAGVVDLTVTAETNDARIWAFVSVSNNETQRVTLFTPQHKTPGGVR